MRIAPTRSHEQDAILALYPLAFPDEDLRGLVLDLLSGNAFTISLGAYLQDVLIGHVNFTIFDGVGADGGSAGALLGPLCVVPDAQRKGVGKALVHGGFDALRAVGVQQVFVLGDPNYYQRFGFQACSHPAPPYDLPQEWAGAWQCHKLGEANSVWGDRIELPEAWMKPALWLP